MFICSYLQEIDSLKLLMAECSEDNDMLSMATEELGQAIEEEKRLQNLLLKSLLPKDDADERDCILEVRAGNWYLLNVNASSLIRFLGNMLSFFKMFPFSLFIDKKGVTGTGGEEASLFAMDIFKM